jgi:hypothetical protein
MDDLRNTLEARYGLVEWEAEVSSCTGFKIQRYTDGSLTIDQSGHIAWMLSDLGANNLSYVSKPSLDEQWSHLLPLC